MFHVGSNRHGESASFLVSGEADDVETEGDEAVDEEGQELPTVHMRLSKEMDPIDFAGEIGIDDALDESEGGHAHEEV